MTPHVYHFILPSLPKERPFSGHLGGKGNEVGIKGKNLGPGQALATKWSVNEREQLKKMLMIYGYGRWSKMRKNFQEVDGSLKKKSDTELRAYSVAFIKSILEYLNFEKNELKKYLTSIVDDNISDDFYVAAKPSNYNFTSRGMG